MKRFKKLRKRVTAFIAAVIISLMSLFDCGIYRPMEVYAASATLGGLALLSDILFGLGMTFAGVEVVKQTAADIASYADTEAEAIKESGKTTIRYSAAGVEHGGAGKSFELTSADVAVTKEILNGTKTINSGDTVPLGFVNTLRAWANKRLNVSAVSGTLGTSIIVPMDTYMHSFPSLPLNFTDSRGLEKFWSTGEVWCQTWSRSNLYDYVQYWAKSGTTIYSQDFDSNTGKWGTIYSYTFTGVTNSGYVTVNTDIHNGIVYPSYFHDFFTALLGENHLYLPQRFDCSPATVIIRPTYLDPTIDVAFADAANPTWAGETDLDKTVAAQKAAVTAGTKDDYVDKVIAAGSGGGTTTSDVAYKQLNYVLGVLGGYWGLTDVTSAVTDAFIADLYKDYVHGSSAEKLEQAEAVRDKFVVVNGTGGDNDDNNNKDFKVLNTLVNAYLACLIANKLLPDSTPEPAPDTQIENVQVTEPAVDPDPGPDPGPDPDPSPGIDLSGVLSWLSKIYDGIISIPQHIASIGDKLSNIPEAISNSKLGQWVKGIGDTLTGIPDAISNSKLGQWVKSIPDILSDIKTKILEIPELLPDILSAIQALPNAITSFFTIDMLQIGAAYNGMSDAFKSKFSVLNQIGGMFSSTGRSFSDTPPVIKMQTPDALKFAIKEDQMVVMDLTKYADLFIWCRGLLTATIWVAFAKWLLDQFNVNFHVG